jgi:hypothetical protein
MELGAASQPTRDRLILRAIREAPPHKLDSPVGAGDNISPVLGQHDHLVT